MLLTWFLVLVLSFLAELARTAYVASAARRNVYRAVVYGGLTSSFCLLLVLVCVTDWLAAPWSLVGDMVGTWVALRYLHGGRTNL